MGEGGANQSAQVILADGECYWAFVASEWVYAGNLVGSGPTPAATQTWGSLKAKYR